jgi:hypothetical protein
MLLLPLLMLILMLLLLLLPLLLLPLLLLLLLILLLMLLRTTAINKIKRLTILVLMTGILFYNNFYYLCKIF